MIRLKDNLQLCIGILLIVSFSMGGCAAKQNAPTANKVKSLLIVEFGDVQPEGEFILLFPNGIPIDLLVSIEGGVFTAMVNTSLSVVLKNDIYVYKKWVSLDLKNWIKDRRLILSTEISRNHVLN